MGLDDFSEQLEPGERLLWSGRPAQGLRLQPADALLIPFSLVWGGFALFWEGGVLTSWWAADAAGRGVLTVFALFGLPFVGMGLYVTVGRFFMDARARARTRYGLTDRRVIIASGSSTTDVRSLALEGLHDVTLRERGDGSGSIVLGHGTGPAFLQGTTWPGAASRTPPTLDGIPKCRDVHRTLLEARARRR